jgi:hypothetical protein
LYGFEEGNYNYSFRFFNLNGGRIT